ncbi:zinc finger MYM-type protein 1-like [Rhineura floridana]|uniref:zinc finger MYM-type protein 1-like n=1 Tax=Rhineura floridana TaxID=261503 RepID=UPI002AC85E0C|nr:zinc finger MYM-type protein 1-like [Rhineura floridana]XP_061457101.1 zinc finger MYM-type protein 1-like [Rhineura floridana]
MNTVEALQATSFSSRSLEDKLKIKELGPDKPPLVMPQAASGRGKQYTRKFSLEWYEKKRWLCGSSSKDALFCFPCLLFGGERTWTQVGVRDVKHLAEKIKTHEASKAHIDCSFQLAMLRPPSPAAHRVEDSVKRNPEVENNRYVLWKIIDCIRFCGAFDLALRGHDETENPGMFISGLVSLMASVDVALELQLQSVPMFRDLSKNLLNELLDCMFTVVRDHIKQQLKRAEYAAVEVDDVGDVAGHVQNVLILWYIDEEGSLVERFYGFTQMKDSRPETFAAFLLQQLAVLFPEEEDKSKVIAQSYDGASVMRSEPMGVQKRIRNVFPSAHYVHCYAQDLDLIIQQATSQIKEVRVFFSELSRMAAFFAGSQKRKEALETSVKRKLFNIQTVELVFEKRWEVIRFFQTIADWESDQAAILEAKGFLEILERDRAFLYLLSLFYKIMVCVHILNSELQEAATDSGAVRRATSDFVKAIGSIRESVRGLFCELPPESQLPRDKSKEILVEMASEVCGIVIAHMNERFAFTSHLSAVMLLTGTLFPEHHKRFPIEAFHEVVEAYPTLEKERFRSELSVLYVRQEWYGCADPSMLLNVILEQNLKSVFEEAVKLMKILTTTPMPMTEAQRASSSLQKVKTFLRNTVVEDQLSALAMLSLEKQMIPDIPDFNSRTIEVFANLKERQADFL